MYVRREHERFLVKNLAFKFIFCFQHISSTFLFERNEISARETCDKQLILHTEYFVLVFFFFLGILIRTNDLIKYVLFSRNELKLNSKRFI